MIKIKAVLLRQTPKGYFLDCEGDKQWFPKSQVTFDEKSETLSLPEWLYEEKFPNEPV